MVCKRAISFVSFDRLQHGQRQIDDLHRLLTCRAKLGTASRLTVVRGHLTKAGNSMSWPGSGRRSDCRYPGERAIGANQQNYEERHFLPPRIRPEPLARGRRDLLALRKEGQSPAFR